MIYHHVPRDLCQYDEKRTFCTVNSACFVIPRAYHYGLLRHER